MGRQGCCCNQRTMRFTSALLIAALAFVSAEETAVEEQNKLEPLDIPRDKCGVVVSAHEDDRLCIFAVGQDQQIYHKFQTSVGGDWSSWSSLGGTFRGGPQVVRNAFAKLVLFARGADKAVWTKMQVQANGEAWTSWTSLGGKFSSSPVAILNSEGFLHIFAKNFADNSLMHKFQFANTNGTCWSDWLPLVAPSPVFHLCCLTLSLSSMCLFVDLTVLSGTSASWEPTNLVPLFGKNGRLLAVFWHPLPASRPLSMPSTCWRFSSVHPTKPSGTSTNLLVMTRVLSGMNGLLWVASSPVAQALS